MGHLVTMLTYPLVKTSTQLTDKLLHILNLVSEGFTEVILVKIKLKFLKKMKNRHAPSTFYKFLLQVG